MYVYIQIQTHTHTHTHTHTTTTHTHKEILGEAVSRREQALSRSSATTKKTKIHFKSVL
jgi:hypothetical protein